MWARVLNAIVDGCGRCFPGDTSVATPHGPVAIAKLKVGDTVLAEDPAKGKLEPEKVQAVIDDGVKPLLVLDLSDGSTLKVTSNHPFWVDGGPGLDGSGWLQAGQLRPGDRLRTASGKDVTVVEVRWNVGNAVVYTLTVANDHTYYVGAAQVLVHNAQPPPLNDPVPGTVPYNATPLSQAVYNERLELGNFKGNNFAAAAFDKGPPKVLWSIQRGGETVHAERLLAEYAKANGLKIKSLYSELSPCVNARTGGCAAILSGLGLTSDDITYSFVRTGSGGDLPKVLQAARWFRDGCK